jgi:hypothetical protein
MCKAKIKEMGWFVRTITGGWAAAITLAPFGIYVKKDYLPPYWNYKVLANHENIHWKQQMEMFIIFFYLWYLIEWIIRIFVNGKKAYISLSFEREAHANDDNLNYLETRKKFSWFKYIKSETGN